MIKLELTKQELQLIIEGMLNSHYKIYNEAAAFDLINKLKLELEKA